MQISMFDIGADAYYKITKPIRLIELFAGIGSQAKALTNLGFKFEHYRICEFDKYAVQSYNAIHGTNFETSDITKISSTDLGIEETDKYEYIMTYSFPCTDLSLAGKREGMARGSGTRSGLLWEIERLLGETTELPQILLMENVPQVLNRDFGGWLEFLEKLGYHNYYELLNAKNYGIPQNRNRCFMVSVLGDYYYEFPKPIKLELRLRDMLENNVAKKYYLSDKMMDYCTDMTNRKGFIRGERFKPHNIEDEYAFAITTNAGSRATDNFIKEPLIAAMRGRGVENKQQLETGGELSNTITTVQKDNLVLEPTLIQVAQLDGYESSGRIYSPDGLAPTINTMGGGQREPKITVDKIARKVEIRKNEVDIEGLQKLLRENKSLSCKNIAEKLGIPQTKAEHWFRVDSGFAIPDREIWLEIKELLGITDNSFDAQIMDFEIIDNNYDMGNRTYDMNGLSPTITSASTPLIKKEQIESEKGYAVAEIGDGVYINRPHQKRGCVQKDCIQTIKTSSNDIGVVVPNQAVSDYRIRKLTPKECWRLMGFSDTDFDKAKESGVSNCQLYKQAGNSIVVNVLMAIFKQLIWEE